MKEVFTLDANTIISLISSVGFPIVACVALYYSNFKQGERHREEMDKLRTSLDENTKAIISLQALVKNIVDK